MKEEWKGIAGYEGLYEVSDAGNVRSIERLQPHGRGGTLRSLKGRLIRGWVGKGRKGQGGYMTVALSKDGKVRKFSVSNLVCDAFHPNPNNLPCVNHKDGNKTNNAANNLEHCTYSDNNRHAFKLGLKAPVINWGEACGTHKLTEEEVNTIRFLKSSCRSSYDILGAMFGVSKSAAWRAATKRTWSRL